MRQLFAAPKSLIPYSKNPRDNHGAIEAVKLSIKEFGFNQPIVVDKSKVIIVGHTRREAAIELGLRKVPYMVADHLTKSEARAYRLADNRTNENSSWLEEQLHAELMALTPEQRKTTAFTDDELHDILNLLVNEGLTDPDEIPEPPKTPITKAGDLWLLGDHRLLCGDATKADDVTALLNGAKPHLMVTDPPYGVDYDPAWRNTVQPSPDRALGTGSNASTADWREAWVLFPGDVAYVWNADKKVHVVGQSLENAGFELRQQIIWCKSAITFGRSHYQIQHEPCWYAVRNKGHWNGSRKLSTVWNIDKPRKSKTGHSAQKPVQCMKRPLENNSRPGEIVYDPFIGSGTTIIAAEMTDRHCYGIEITPQYVDVAVKRWEDFTGKKAERKPAKRRATKRGKAKKGH